MNIHITCTPGFTEEKLTKVVSLLSSTIGEIKFEPSKIWNNSQFSAIDKRFYNVESISSLSFEEYFHLIKAYRTFHPNIKKNEFVILISTIKHDEEWFSAFDGRNIFVHAGDWDQISDADPIFGIAYQCLENIFQSLLELNIHDYKNDFKNEPNIHRKSIGCINDYCDDKKDILNKLRTADICESCLEKASKSGVDPKVIEQIGSITEKIRQAFISKRKFAKTPKLKQVVIDGTANIKIGKDTFNPIGEIPKLLFIYFLKHPEGVASKNLDSKKDEFLRIYKLIKQKDGKTDKYSNTNRTYELTIENLCCESGKSSFRTYKSRLNSELEKLLGLDLAFHYQVQSKKLRDRSYLFKINLNHDFMSIDPRF